jgi:protein-tyrosine phosphatase
MATDKGRDKIMENIRLEGINNIRDLGTTVVNEGRIKKHKILRSPCLDELTQRDVNTLVNKYNLTTIIDLRTDWEAQYNPDVDIFGINYIHIPIFNKSAPGITHENDNGETEYSVDFAQMYAQMLQGDCLENVSEIIRTIINLKREDYAVLIHCSEGKDRTGLIIAILLLILGADKETVIDDYLYTNKANKVRAYKRYLKTFFFDADFKRAERARDVYLAKREYIEAIFAVIENEWFGLDNFIRDGLKITNSEIEDFKDKLLC